MLLLLLLVVFSGLLIGLIIGWLAEEELKPGMPYLEWLGRLLLLAIVIIFFYYNTSFLFILLISLILIVFSFSRERETLYYSATAIILCLSWMYNGFFIIAPLVFLYGFPLGSIHYYAYHTHYNSTADRSKKKRKSLMRMIISLLLRYLPFLLLGLIFYILG